MKNLISSVIAALAMFHLVTGIYLLFTEPNQTIFFITFFIGIIYTAIFLLIEKSIKSI